MQNFLFVSLDGLIGDIAWRVQNEGNEVRYAITEDEFSQDVADGIVPKTDDWRDDLEWADIVVFDDAFGLGEYAQKVRDRGIPAIGGSSLTDQLEADRGFAAEQMDDRGLRVIPSKIFEDFDVAIEFIRENPSAYVIKPCGDAQHFKRLLYVGQAEDGADVIQVLERYRRKWGDEIDEFQLQRRIDGVEVSVCGFFNGDRFLDPVNVTFEHKRLFPGGLGPMTGEMGTSMLWTPKNSLFAETIGRFASLLSGEDYHGPFDINCIVNEDGIFPLEITPRFGYPQINIQEEALETPIDEFLYGVATGDREPFSVHDGYQVGFRICVPPFPADDVEWFDESSRNAIIGFRDDAEEEADGIPVGIHLEDMKYADGEYRIAGETGEVLVVVGTGDSMQKAQREAYTRAEQVILPHKFYRNDIGDRWHDDIDHLLRWGYLQET
ncbi:MAG: phosphoribosylamine--glycine ligase [Halobacteriales archaeon]